MCRRSKYAQQRSLAVAYCPQLHTTRLKKVTPQPPSIADAALSLDGLAVASSILITGHFPSEAMCGISGFFYTFLACVTFLQLAIIAFDRYVFIPGPELLDPRASQPTPQPQTEPWPQTNPTLPQPRPKVSFDCEGKQLKLQTLGQIGTVGTLVILVYSLLPMITSNAYGTNELHWGRLACYPEGGQGVVGHNIYCASLVMFFLFVSTFMILCYYAIYRKVRCHCHTTVANRTEAINPL